MLVDLISRPLTHLSHIPRRGVSSLAEGLRDAGATVVEDVWVTPSNDMDAAFTAGALELRERWVQRPPDVVHTLGIVATMTAVKAGGGAPVVATFTEAPVDAPLERKLAGLVAGVIPLSRAEGERWRRHGVPTLSAGTFPLAMVIPDIDACARDSGDVVTLSSDGSLDALVASMPMWAPRRLVIGTRLSPARLAGVRRLAEGVGVLSRVHYRPEPRGEHRAAMWEEASVVVAGADASRHGWHVLEAAAHGIPSIAVAQDAHLDHVLPGTTGILVPPAVDARALGRAVASVLGDSFRLRAMGTSALVRIQSLQAPDLAGRRLMSLYDEELATSASTAPAVVPLPAEACVGCVASCALCPALAGVDVEGRNALAVENLPLARQLARWYSGRGQSTEDLVQVASLGLVHAAERYDPSHGKEFHSFAIPTILGELRRHFRDHAWAMRVPRTLQDTALRVQRATRELGQTLGRDVTVADLVEALGLAEEEIRLAQQVDTEAAWSRSLDHPMGESDTLADLLGELDPQLDLVELRSDVRAVLRRLPEREQQILLMRFYGERTQSEIAHRLGISQVQVSRVLSRTLTAVRDHILDDVPLPRAWDQEPDRGPGARPDRGARTGLAMS